MLFKGIVICKKRRKKFGFSCILLLIAFFILLSCILHILMVYFNQLDVTFNSSEKLSDIFSNQLKKEILGINKVDDVEFTEIVGSYRFVEQIGVFLEKDNKFLESSENSNSNEDPTIISANRSSTMMTSQYLFLLGHYEQLGKTAINFLQAGLLATLLNRNLVEPFVRHSRFCGLRSGWTGAMRKKSREFLPLDNYFEMESIYNIFSRLSLNGIVNLEHYLSHCPSTTMIYFFYAGGKDETKRYLNFSEEEYSIIESKLKENGGLTNCSFIEEKISTSSRIKGLFISQGICIDVELIKTIARLKQIIQMKKCVSIFLWRGVGYQRAHFNITLPQPHEFYLSQIKFSKLVYNEINNFIREKFKHNSYLGIHIRSERLLLWYNIDRFKECLDNLEKVVNILVVKKKIKHIFLSSDIGPHGSDQIITLNSSVVEKARYYFNKKLEAINAVLFTSNHSRGLIYNDTGFIALTELGILSQSHYLVTLGTGTFQGWIVMAYKNYKKISTRSWSLTRVCSTELKNIRDRKKS
ncbi:uncharacterized protein LOC105843285 isoform X2 [Hydra vulgaris]|uniref:Uncharacterized protein LOC105843285 isoform X2 n=1 Tax=Hydra vulgaris TaxID=6087 RepID=A0ABM4C6J9_HYDVU